MIHFETLLPCYFLLLIFIYAAGCVFNHINYHNASGICIIFFCVFLVMTPIIVLCNFAKTVIVYEEVEILKKNDRDMVMIDGRYINLNKKFGKTFDEKSHAYRVFYVDTMNNFIVYPDDLIVTQEPLQELNVHPITKRDY